MIMTEYDKEFLDKLKQLCLEFDSKAESYPDPDYVGFALYYFATHPNEEFNPAYGGSIDSSYLEGGAEYLEELNKLDKSEKAELDIPSEKPHFIFHIDPNDLETFIKEFLKRPHKVTKLDFFENGSPEWLADEFIINKVSFEYGIDGSAKVEPVDDLCVIDERTHMIMKNKTRHEGVNLFIYRGVSLSINDIKEVAYDD